MKYKLYQINLEKDTARYCFTGKDSLEKLHLKFPPPADLYELKYEGNCDKLNPNDLWIILNDNHPSDYKTRSLSISDIIVYDLGESNLALFCDSYSFIAVEFSDGKIEEIKTEYFIKDGYAYVIIWDNERQITVKAEHLLSGCNFFKDQNGIQTKLTPAQIYTALYKYFDQQYQQSNDSTHKTFEGWTNSGAITFDDYVNIGDTVDEEIVNNFLCVLPPASHTQTYLQMGEAQSMQPDDNGKYRPVFMTFKQEDDKWFYKGYCFLGETANRRRFKTFYERYRELLRV